MNDSKNLILAVVLSALVLLGWSWAANKYFPTANPPSTKIENGKQQPCPSRKRSLARRPAPKALRTRSAVLGSTPRVRIQTPSLAGLDQPQGRADRRSDAGPPARDDRQEFAAGAAAVAARRAGRLHRLVRLDRPGRRRSRRSTRCGPPTARRSRPAIRSRSTTQMPDGARYQIKIAVDEGYLFTVRQSVTERSARSRSRSARSASSAARSNRTIPDSWTNHVGPISVFDGKAELRRRLEDLDEAGSAERSTTSPAGSASPTNIG